MMCRHLMIYRIELCPGHHLLPVHFRNSAIMVYCLVLHLFPVPAFLLSRYVGVIAYVFCHVGVLVCLFVVNVADFSVIEF